jgi:hypothetical protein
MQVLKDLVVSTYWQPALPWGGQPRLFLSSFSNEFSSPVILFGEISFPVTHLMPHYAETGRSCPLIA